MMKDKQAEYCDICNLYESSREERLIDIVIKCLENKKKDVVGFQEAWNGYNNIVNVDRWQLDLIEHISGYMGRKKEKKDIDELEKELMGGNSDDDDDDVIDDGDEKDKNDGKGKQRSDPFQKLDKDELIGAPDPSEFIKD